MISIVSIFRALTLNEILAIMETWDEDDPVESVEVTMEPPVNAADEQTDEDSEDDDQDGSANHLPASQLAAPSFATVRSFNNREDNTIVGAADETIIDVPANGKSAPWIINKDIREPAKQFECHQKVFNQLHPYELFELFFDADVQNLIIDQTNLYALQTIFAFSR